MGTKLTIEDAIALAENLRHCSSFEVALQSYETQRQAALLQPQSEAHFSAQWFENISRYIDLEPDQFSMLLHGSRSPLLPHIPPRLYYRLLWASEEVTILQKYTKVSHRGRRRSTVHTSVPSWTISMTIHNFKQTLE